MADVNYNELVAKCDLLIKSGKIRQVAVLMAELNLASVPRQWRQALAKICRRASLASLGLRLLHPIVRQGKESFIEPATEGEICEYAVLLLASGSLQEASNLLAAVNDEKTPQALLYSGFCEVARWEYDKAAELYGRYLLSKVDEYSKLIARVNLASCFVVLSKLDEAESLLNETMTLAEHAGAKRLIGNCFELLGQVYFWRDQFSLARKNLDHAHEVFSQTGSFDELQIQKTRSIMLSLEDNSLIPLHDFRGVAKARRHWDSVREADLFALKVQFNQKTLDHLIFGTPFVGYRKRIEKIVGHSPSQSYTLGSDKSACLDLSTGLIDGISSAALGTKNHQLLAAVLKDLYRPRNLGSLFAELYPGEYFNINSSPYRVRQSVMRVRKWLLENQVPAQLIQEKGSYRFEISGCFGIKLSLQTESIDPMSVKWESLKQAFSAGQAFTADQACQKLSWSRMTFIRVIEFGRMKRELEKVSNGKYTRYIINLSQHEKIHKAA